MLKKFLKFTARLIMVVFVSSLLIFGLPTVVSELYARSRTFTVAAAPSAPVAVVFGAGLTRDGRPTPILRDRVATAADLYFQGKVNKILMSGDNRFIDYNEPGAMRQFALELGVPDEDIVLDYAGRRTYDTCYRARHIFGVTDALVVTQNFHLGRVLLTCNALGIRAAGVKADQREYNRYSMRFWRIREIGATTMAVVDVYITRPLPVLGKPEPIFPQENSQNNDLSLMLEKQ